MPNKKTKISDLFTKIRQGLKEKIGSDSRSTPSPEGSTRELEKKDKTELKKEEKINLTPYEKYVEFQKQNKENSKEFIYRDRESIMLKLNRPFAIQEYVVLLKDYPDDDLYRGYVCVIIDIYYDWSSLEDNTAHDYQVEFFSDFDEKDPSIILARKPEINCEVIPSTIIALISGRDLLRIEMQDLRYRISFPKMF